MAEELNEIKKAFQEVRETLEAARPKPFLQIIGELSKVLKPHGSLVSPKSRMIEPEPSEGARREEVPRDEPSMTPSSTIIPYRPLLSLKELFPVRRALAASIQSIGEGIRQKLESEAKICEIEAAEKAKWLPKGSIRLRK